MTKKLLFVSYHCYIDPSSGAALATRDLLNLLADRGWECRVFCGPTVDFEQAESVEQLLADQRLAYSAQRHEDGSASFSVLRFVQSNVPVTLFLAAQVAKDAPLSREAHAFLAIYERLLDRFRPDVVLTYGGQEIAQDAIKVARSRGTPVVIALHNLAYANHPLFLDVQAILVPSRFAARHYERVLGRACTAIASVIDVSRVHCPTRDPRYVTFVNPQPHKGLTVFARFALELGRRRPDIPLLVVEGRGRTDQLAGVPLDLSKLSNLHVMANTPDPRDFYRVSRVVVMPSLCEETFGRVAAEAMSNGIPVLASDRGALPEVLGDSGFLFQFPKNWLPERGIVPSAAEVAPWVNVVIRLWDDSVWYESQCRRSLAAASAWGPEHLASKYEKLFSQFHLAGPCE